MPYFAPLAAASGLLGASGPSPYPVGLGQVLGAGLQSYLQYLPMDEEQKRRQGLQKTLEEISRVVTTASKRGGAAGGRGAGPMPKGPSPVAPASFQVPSTYYDQLKMAESGGRNVGSATSSATGPYQFIRASWDDTVTRHPELGLTSADRTNPAAQESAVRAFTADNAQQLMNALGRRPSLGELNLAHKLGAGGAIKALQSDPATPLEDVVGSNVIKANPTWRGLSTGEFLGQMAGQVGGGGSAAAPAPAAPAGAPNPALAALLQPQQPTGLESIDPQTAQILSLALQDEQLAPHALGALLQLTVGRRGGGQQLPADILSLMLAGIDPTSPQGQQAILGHLGGGTETPSIVREAQYLYPSDPAKQRTYIEASRTRPTTTVSITGEQETEFGKAIGKAAGERYKAIQSAAGSAIDRLGQLDQFQALLGEVTTGPGADFGQRASAYADAVFGAGTADRLGLPKADAGAALKALGNQFALQLRNPESGAGLPGAVSDRDLQFLKESIPGLENTPAGNQLIIEGMRRLAQRQVELGRVADAYLTDAQDSGEKPKPSEFNARIRDYVGAHPLFDDSYRARVDAIRRQNAGAGSVLQQPQPAPPAVTPAQILTMPDAALDSLLSQPNADELLQDEAIRKALDQRVAAKRGSGKALPLTPPAPQAPAAKPFWQWW